MLTRRMLGKAAAMAFGGAGGLPERRPDQIHDAVPPALGAGPRSTTFPVLIVKGSRAGVFIYNAAGQLVDSMAFLANVDPLTHTNFQGTVNYFPGLNFAQLFDGQLFLGTLNVSSTITHAGQVSLGDSLTPSQQPHIAIEAPITSAGGGAAIFLNGESQDTTKPGQVVITTSLEAVTTSFCEVQGGDLAISIAGFGLRVKEGSNAKQGIATLTAGTILVANTSVTANSRIHLTAQDNNSTGALRVSARTAGTSFTITSSNAADSGVVAYEIFEPA